MVNTSADDVDTMVDDQRIVLPEQGQEMQEHTPQPQHRAPAVTGVLSHVSIKHFTNLNTAA